jgi:hypothetical protein
VKKATKQRTAHLVGFNITLVTLSIAKLPPVGLPEERTLIVQKH